MYIKKGGEKILKKYLVTFGLLETLTFLGLFVYLTVKIKLLLESKYE
jgi:F0F1-type ATP synthase membrane subunit c/vacuolar-type H+-ATPase subunit K